MSTSVRLTLWFIALLVALATTSLDDRILSQSQTQSQDAIQGLIKEHQARGYKITADMIV